MHASSVLESRAQPNYRARVHQLAFENMNIHPMATAAGYSTRTVGLPHIQAGPDDLPSVRAPPL